ncbi:hypothetical protein CBER1_11453 [Cercospora berteroae]|uniref:Uncharacterized protein n=1 Tax=Cercospora berteroae TaxID=357750 RepID=A0A2S6C059_9PEZI|nr:hypothetical protein CBER1_11453 [Cercospora berteroae]
MAEMARDGETPRDEFAEHDIPEQRFLIPPDFQASSPPLWEFRDLPRYPGRHQAPIAADAVSGAISADDEGEDATGTNQDSNEQSGEDSDHDAEHEESDEEGEEQAEEDDEECDEEEENITKDEVHRSPRPGRR